MRWQSWSLAHFSKEGCEPLLFQRIVKQILKLGPPDEARDCSGSRMRSTAKPTVLDTHLAKQPYLVGKDADPRRLFSRAHCCSMPNAPELPLASYPNLKDWFARISSLPCWQETAPQFTAAAA